VVIVMPFVVPVLTLLALTLLTVFVAIASLVS
jgi:hypothetical protein